VLTPLLRLLARRIEWSGTRRAAPRVTPEATRHRPRISRSSTEILTGKMEHKRPLVRAA